MWKPGKAIRPLSTDPVTIMYFVLQTHSYFYRIQLDSKKLLGMIFANNNHMKPSLLKVCIYTAWIWNQSVDTVHMYAQTSLVKFQPVHYE